MTRRKEEKPRVLQLLRHAKSSWRDGDLADRDRPLNARGHRAGRLLTAHFAREAPPDLVLCSSARRTRETFDHIAGAYAAPPPVLMEDGLYLGGAQAIMRRIEAVPDSVETLLVIGHNPGLHELAAALARHGARRDRGRLAAKFPTGALASFRLAGRWEDIAHAPLALTSYVTPADLGGAGEDDD
jgi:phosphohistidine phosphatase